MMMQANDPPPRFRFTGQYTDSDLEALAAFSVSQLLDQRIGRATVSFAFLLAVAAVLLRSWGVAIGGFVALLGMSALVRYMILPRRLIRHVRAQPGLFGNRVIELQGGEIHHASEGREQVFRRADVRRLVLHRNHLFILLKPSGCVMLPLGWIQSPATIDQVVEFLVPRHD